MSKFIDALKPVLALAVSVLLGAFIVLGSVAMLGNAAHPAPSVSAPRVLEGLGRFNSTDIRVVP